VCLAESFLGARWKCCECHDYDLCDECYHADKHDVTHEFRRFDLATSPGFVVASGVDASATLDGTRKACIGKQLQHWRQPRRGCRGHIPNILVGGTSTGISPKCYYVLSDIADQYWLPSVRSASSRFHSAIRRHQFASVRQADSWLTRLAPPTLNSR